MIIDKLIRSCCIGRAMIPAFDENGYLPPGLHGATLEEFKTRFVDDVVESETRTDIYAGYLKYSEDLSTLDILIKQWLDGSFTTKKINPNDLDLFSQVDALKLNNKYICDQFLRLVVNKNQSNRKLLNTKYKCDPFAIAVYPQGHKLYNMTAKTINYWLTSFGHDMKVPGKPPKGMIDLK